MRSPFKHLRNIRFRVPLMFQKCFSSLLSSISDKDVGELSNDLHLFGSNCYGTWLTRPFPRLLALIIVPVRSSRVSAILGNPRGRRTDWIGHAPSLSRGLQPLSKEGDLTLIVRWNGKEYTLRNCTDDSVAESKRRICFLTNVLRKRQKLLYPKDIVDDSELGKDKVVDVEDKELNKQKLRRRIDQLSSKPEKNTTSVKQYHGVKKLEKVLLGELNNYVLESPPQFMTHEDDKA
ncbi:hypothetical protein Bca4012_019097 [Brassica carinata]